jgi:hypothetical protein
MNPKEVLMKLLLVYCDSLDEIININSCKDCDYYKGNDNDYLWCDYEDTIEPLEEELEIIP